MTTPQLCNPALAAIDDALADADGEAFLDAWNHGEFDVLRREWANIPDAVFLAAEVSRPLGQDQVLDDTNPAAIAALDYAISPEHRCDEPMVFLQIWRNASFDTLRKEWPNVPKAVFCTPSVLWKTSARAA